MELHTENCSKSKLEAEVQKLAYKLLRDARVVELSQRLKPLEEASNEL
jgi:hypothetical protein